MPLTPGTPHLATTRSCSGGGEEEGDEGDDGVRAELEGDEDEDEGLGEPPADETPAQPAARAVVGGEGGEAQP
jgi:hypothetical protein